jgi:hypothetical protein
MKYPLLAVCLGLLSLILAVAPSVGETTHPVIVAISATTPPMPRGNYGSTCKNIRVAAHFTQTTVTHYMMGECLDNNGYRRESQVKIPCPNNGPVDNKNGLLVCA